MIDKGRTLRIENLHATNASVSVDLPCDDVLRVGEIKTRTEAHFRKTNCLFACQTTFNRIALASLFIMLLSPLAQSLEGQIARIKNQHFKAFEPFVLPQTGDKSIRVAQDFHPAALKKNTPFGFQPLPYKTVTTNLRGFGVPFQINADNGSFIEVQLYVSRDRGKSWQFAARQTTDKKEFPFESKEDGEYWFALKTLDRDRKLLPEGDPQIDLKIVVDTVKPELDFRIETDAAGRIACRWHATDENISPQSLRIFYQPIGDDGVPEDWKRIPINLPGTARAGIYADQLAWWPDTAQQAINVAVEIKDIAGNTVQLTRQVQVTQAGWRHQRQSTAQVATNERAQSGGDWTLPQPGQEAPPAPSDPVLPPANRKVAQGQGDHPPNVVCKDGVCQLVKSPAAPQANGSGTRGFAAAGSHPSGNRSQSQRQAMKLVGSEVEFVPPPVPDEYDPRQAAVQAAPPSPFKHSQNQAAENYLASRRPNSTAASPQVWKSETDESIPKPQSSSSTTLGPDPTLAPIAYSNPWSTPRQSVTNVPSNPPSMIRNGNKVIGESSTMGATNQYRGLNTQGGRPIPQPTLLPGVEGTSSRLNQQQSRSDRTLAPIQNGSSKPKSLASVGYRPPSSPSRPTRDVMPTRESKAPIQIIGSKRFRLNYGIDSIDPSGVAGVDLWLTRDDGTTWQAWGSDPDSRSPFPVEVQQEGRYGFKIVVHSKDGLTGQGPSSGDDPDMWILVDTQSPLARISSVPYGRGKEAGRLVINYSVSDKFLTLRPIVLAYSPNPQGPWEVIGDGLRNEGRFVWKPTPDVPDRIFLRIDALDKAGNVGVHVLSQAIDVSGLVPRGTIHGVVPVGTR